MTAPPTGHQGSNQSDQPSEGPQVVSGNDITDDQGRNDEVAQAVLKWVDRVEAADQRGNADGNLAAHGSSPTTQAADIEFPISRDGAADPWESPGAPAVHSGADGDPDRGLSAATAPPSTVAPPALAEVLVRPAPDAPGTLPEPGAPQINAPAYARTASTSLREFLEQSLPGEDSSFREQLDRRMLWVMAGDYERARAPLTLVTAEQQELAIRFVEAWIAVRDWHMGDPSRAAGAAARELDELRRSLQRLSDLSMPTVRICSAVRSFGQYDALEPARFLAGTPAEFVLYCEVRDFVSELRDDMYVSSFDMTTTILNRAGDTMLEIKDANIIDRCRNRRHDCFIPRLIRLPTTLPPGQYVAKITLADKLGQKVAENAATFQLVASQ